MFIHWGLYAITGCDLWFYSHEEVPKEKYEQLFGRFNPMDYDPEEWARLAKRAGMKYAVLITKHHDGFCLWDSAHTVFKVTNTPYGKDILNIWLDACRAEGLKVGVYYSLLDWHHPHFTVDHLHPERARAAELNKGRDFSKYVEYLHNQVREWMTRYGRIDIFWPDYSHAANPKMGFDGKHAPQWQSEKLKKMVEELQPGILVNNRLGLPGEMPADFTTPEQHIPEDDPAKKGNAAPMWEKCQTIGASWGYHRGDRDLKSTARLISDLVTCVSKNGNLLLNVGPTPRGRIQPEFVERLTQIGEWMELHGDSFHGADRAFCPPSDNGCAVRQPPENTNLAGIGGELQS
jgi:alpha-L-fucosidase